MREPAPTSPQTVRAGPIDRPRAEEGRGRGAGQAVADGDSEAVAGARGGVVEGREGGDGVGVL
jgi:hypothetical protein